MAAPIAVHRTLAAELRTLSLNKMIGILSRPTIEMNEKDKELHDALLLKLAGSVLPRLNEITGEDGGAVQVSLVKYADHITAPVPAETVPTTDAPSV